MAKLTPIDGPHGRFFVEVVEVETPPVPGRGDALAMFPAGAEQISAIDRAAARLGQVRALLANAVEIVTQAIEVHRPDETEVEISVGFGGELGIPFVTSGKAEAGLKVKLTWRKA